MATQASDGSSKRSTVTLTLEECLEEINIRRKDWRFVDPKLWDNNVEAPNNEVDPTAATTYVARRIDDYTNGLAADEELFWDFRHDFQGWNEAMLRRTNNTYTKELKRILRFKGVFTGHINIPPVEALTNLLSMDDYLRWPTEQLAEHSLDQRSVAYRRQQEHKIQGQHTGGSVQTPDVRTVNRALRNQTLSTARNQEMDNQQTYPQDQTQICSQVDQQQEQRQRRVDPLPDTIECMPQPVPLPGRIKCTPQLDLLKDTIECAPQPDLQSQQTITHQFLPTHNSFERCHESTPACPQCPNGWSVMPIDSYKVVLSLEVSSEKLDPVTIDVFMKRWDRHKNVAEKLYSILTKDCQSGCTNMTQNALQPHLKWGRILYSLSSTSPSLS